MEILDQQLTQLLGAENLMEVGEKESSGGAWDFDPQRICTGPVQACSYRKLDDQVAWDYTNSVDNGIDALRILCSAAEGLSAGEAREPMIERKKSRTIFM